MSAPFETPAWYREQAKHRIEDATENDRRACAIDALVPRLGQLHLVNQDLVLDTLELSGITWRRDAASRMHVVGGIDERGHRCFERRRVTGPDALADFVRAVAEFHRAEAAKCREQADDLLIEAESLEPTPITSSNAA